MKKYGFSPNCISWFKAYLTDRTHSTFCHNKFSDFLKVNTGIPQGSVLGPLMFLLYINDLSTHVPRCNLFADDSMISSSSTNHLLCIQQLQRDITSTADWFISNKLTVNVEKTCIMMLGTRQHTEAYDANPPVMTLNQSPLTIRQEYCYLGLIIDPNLKWEGHVQKVCKKLGPIVSQLSRLRSVLTKSQLNALYFSFVQSHIDYGLTIWGHCSKANLQKVQRFQNWCSRIVTGNFDFNVSSSHLISSLKWLTIAQRRDFLTCILMFKCLHNLAPNYLSDHIVHRSNIHNYSTRLTQNQALDVPFGRSQYFQKSFQVNGPKLWNSLPEHVTQCENIISFKYQYKKWLFPD